MTDQSQDQNFRITPQSSLDFNLMVTDTVWGQQHIAPKLSMEAGDHWQRLALFTRDLRLGNITQEQFEFCNHFLTLGSDLFQEGMNESFVELSQSQKGFLRKILNTIKQEQSISQSTEKRGIWNFGGKK
jgi:hypothetical protein